MKQPSDNQQAPFDFDPRDLAALRQWSHDVRAALSGMIDHLQLVPADQLEDPARQHLLAARQQARAMTRIIAKAMAQLTGEPDRNEAAETDTLENELRTSFGPLARQNGAELTITSDMDLPMRLSIERVTMERILFNLVGNALHHSGARHIEVTFATPGREVFLATVRDDGAGFPPGLLAGVAAGRSFAASDPQEGLGLGIVATLVEELDGRWGVRNPAEGGAEAWVEIPCAVMAVPEATPPGPVKGGQLAGHRILAVDDNHSALALIAAVLGGQGAEVDTLRSGAEAIALLGQKRYDLVIVDATMPNVNGADVVRALRALPGKAGLTPALAVTADSSVQRNDELIAAGTDRVLIKPLPDPAELLRVAERMVKSSSRSEMAQPAGPDKAASARESARASAPDNEPPLFDPEPLTRVCALAGPDMAEEILERLTADLVTTLERLDRASNPPDTAELRAATHVLIALAGTAGAMQLLARTQALNHHVHTGPLGELGPLLAEVKLLTRGAIEAIRRLALKDLSGGGAAE